MAKKILLSFEAELCNSFFSALDSFPPYIYKQRDPLKARPELLKYPDDSSLTSKISPYLFNYTCFYFDIGRL